MLCAETASERNSQVLLIQVNSDMSINQRLVYPRYTHLELCEQSQAKKKSGGPRHTDGNTQVTKNTTDKEEWRTRKSSQATQPSVTGQKRRSPQECDEDSSGRQVSCCKKTYRGERRIAWGGRAWLYSKPLDFLLKQLNTNKSAPIHPPIHPWTRYFSPMSVYLDCRLVKDASPFSMT